MSGQIWAVNLLTRFCHSSQMRTVLLIGLLLGLLPYAFAAEPDAKFRAAKTAFVKQFRKKSAEERVQAVEEIAALFSIDTVDLLIKKGTTDSAPTVKAASQRAIRDLAQDPKVAKAMFEELKRNFKRPSPGDTVPELLRALAITEDEDMQTDILKALDDFLDSPKGNLMIPITLIDDFAKQGDEDAFKAITLFSKSKTFDTKFGYRRCIVQAMSHLKHKDAVMFLINTMPNAQGLVHHDIVLYLTKLTKQKYRDDHQDWLDWWKENGEKFQFPLTLPVVNDEPLDDKLPTYYGMPICAKRIVFVLDTSGSMRGYPIDAAKRALLDVVAKLPEAVHFDIVFFDRMPAEWQLRLVPATEEYREYASQEIRARGLGPGTASFAALYAAFALEPEAIYFLSDGEPTDGSPIEIAKTILLKNKTRRVSIHTIGVITDNSNGAGLSFFMKPLAEQNYGSFHLVQ